MDKTSNTTIEKPVKRSGIGRNHKIENLNMNQNLSTEARLNTHEAVCAERYAGLEIKMTQIDKRFDKVEEDLKEVRASTSKGFSEIKDLIEKRNNSSHTAIITSAGTIIVALIAFLGYLLTHLPK